MIRLNSASFIICLTFVSAFLLGFYVRDILFERQDLKPTKTTEAKLLPKVDAQLKKQEISATNQDIAKLIEKNTYLTANCNPVNPSAQDSETPDLSSQNKSATELLTVLESILAQKKPDEAFEASSEYQQLITLMQTDPAARKLVLERFLEVAGTPLGNMLSTALMSTGYGGDAETEATAVQLLCDGTRQQRLATLSMLGQTLTQDTNTRSMVLGILQNDTSADQQLTLAALSALNRQGMYTLTEQKDVIETITPFLHAKNPEIKAKSLMMLSRAGQDEATRQAITDAANDTDKQVRTMALEMMVGRFDFESARDILLSKIQNLRKILMLDSWQSKCWKLFHWMIRLRRFIRALAKTQIPLKSQMALGIKR